MTSAFDEYWTPRATDAFERFVDDLSKLVHPPLAPPFLLVRRGGVPDALVRARPGVRVVAP
jgi:hypothetical protein